MSKPFRTTAEIQMIMGKPEITNQMEASHHGKHTIEFTDTCFKCYDEITDPDCPACQGNIEYTRKIDVPWEIIKTIYKQMAQTTVSEQALRTLAQEAQDNGFYD